MPFPAARITDLHLCAALMGVPGGPVATGSPNVLTGSLPQARAFQDNVTCVPGLVPIIMGSPTVFCNGTMAVPIVGNATACGGNVVSPGMLTVLIGP